MKEILPLIGLGVAIIGTRRAFRLVIPKSAPYPTMGQYILAWVVVFAWWSIVAYLVDSFV